MRAGEVGVVDRRDPGDRLLLEAGPADDRTAAFATQTQRLTVATPENVPAKFRDLLLRPEGATDWAVYYPPILLGTGIADPTVREAAALLDGGDPAGAERALAAARLEGTAEAAALALRAVAAVSLNDPAAGAALADEAVALDPGLGAAHIARSYALQAQGRLDAARAAAEAAVEAAPDDAYAWARLAELELTIGNRRAAETAVARSLEIAETALGAVDRGLRGARRQRLRRRRGRLPAGDRDRQRGAAAAPRPRPRRDPAGPARRGQARDARRPSRSTRAAPACAPGSAAPISRNRRPDKAAAQLELAQEIDPDDPNTYLFSALERFEANDPIGALRDLETARSRRPPGGGPLGERPRGGRGGAERRRRPRFRRARLRRARHAEGRPRRRPVSDQPGGSPLPVRRVSRAGPASRSCRRASCLRYQLLSPPTNEPVQPSLSEPSLALLTIPGVTRPTFYEFSPLFNRDGWFGVGFGGDREQRHVERRGRVQLSRTGTSRISVGQYHFEDDGFRFNDEVEHSVVSVLAKYAPTPEVTFTAEARARQTNQGDRFLRSFEEPSQVGWKKT